MLYEQQVCLGQPFGKDGRELLWSGMKSQSVNRPGFDQNIPRIMHKLRVSNCRVPVNDDDEKVKKNADEEYLKVPYNHSICWMKGRILGQGTCSGRKSSLSLLE